MAWILQGARTALCIGGRMVETYKLKAGIYEAEILDQGAILYSFSIDGHDIIVGFEDKEENIASDAYFSQVIGPFANRICDARYTMDGAVHTLEANNGRNSLHSGSRNYGFHKWTLDALSASSVTLSLDSPESNGLDGDHHVTVTYSLSESGALSIDYSVTSTRKCPVNITNHAFFNLDGHGDMRKHRALIPADSYIAVDDTLIPTSIEPVRGTDFDFNSMRAIGERRNGEYDHCFILRKGERTVVENDDLRLEMETDLPGVQFYTSGHLDRGFRGKGHTELSRFSAFCLESEFYPDFPNRSDFKGAYLEPGKAFGTRTVFRLTRK